MENGQFFKVKLKLQGIIEIKISKISLDIQW